MTLLDSLPFSKPQHQRAREATPRWKEGQLPRPVIFIPQKALHTRCACSWLTLAARGSAWVVMMNAVYYDPWSNLRYEPDPSPADDPNLLWFNSEVNPDDVLEASEHRTHFEFSVDGKKRVKPGSRHTTVGTKIVVNGKTIAIFKHFGRLYAINNVCPHQRGELHLGDIEEIDKSLCVSCPRHHWPFSLKDGSCSVGVKYQAEVFPVQIRTLRDGRDVIFVGFPSFTRTLFNDDDF